MGQSVRSIRTSSDGVRIETRDIVGLLGPTPLRGRLLGRVGLTGIPASPHSLRGGTSPLGPYLVAVADRQLNSTTHTGDVLVHGLLRPRLPLRPLCRLRINALRCLQLATIVHAMSRVWQAP